MKHKPTSPCYHNQRRKDETRAELELSTSYTRSPYSRTPIRKRRVQLPRWLSHSSRVQLYNLHTELVLVRSSISALKIARAESVSLFIPFLLLYKYCEGIDLRTFSSWCVYLFGDSSEPYRLRPHSGCQFSHVYPAGQFISLTTHFSS